MIRKAETADLSRVAEIYVFNNRLNFYPIFKCPEYSFGELTVVNLISNYFSKPEVMANLYVFDDGIIKGFTIVNKNEVVKLFVDSFFQSQRIGQKLLAFAVNALNCDFLWALEKNTKAIAFYQRNGFSITDEKKYEEGTTEFLVKLVKHRA